MTSPKLRANRRIEKAVQDALDSARRRSRMQPEPDDALFLRTWIIPPLERALRDMRGVR